MYVLKGNVSAHSLYTLTDSYECEGILLNNLFSFDFKVSELSVLIKQLLLTDKAILVDFGAFYKVNALFPEPASITLSIPNLNDLAKQINRYNYAYHIITDIGVSIKRNVTVVMRDVKYSAISSEANSTLRNMILDDYLITL